MDARFRIILSSLVTLLVMAPVERVGAFEPLEGCFIAENSCPALRSIRKGSNPGGMTTELGQTYELLGANKLAATHFQIRIDGASPPDRWVTTSCGRTVEECTAPQGNGKPVVILQKEGDSFPDNLLAVSWQPAFCQTHQHKKECASQTEERFDANNLALHGLWPQPRGNAYCGVDAALVSLDKRGRWDLLPELELTPETREELEKVMPGTQSFLDRHEWIKHGTCYSATPEEYYAESLQLMRELNDSAVRNLFAERIGEEVTLVEIREAFDDAFGEGSGERVNLSCNRGLVGKLRINVEGTIDETTDLTDLLTEADLAGEGCRGGEIDEAGF